MQLNFDPADSDTAPLIGELKETSSFLRRVLLRCNTSWFKTSWLGIFVYTFICCLNYVIAYYAIYTPLGWYEWAFPHSRVRIFGDLVTVGWFAVGFVCLPWHQWEQLTCLKTRDCAGFGRFMAWWLGTIIAFLVFGYIGTVSWLNMSLATPNLSPRQKNVFLATFLVIGGIIVYWLLKLCPTKRCKAVCNPETARKVIFVRLLALLAMLFVLSYSLCNSDTTCTLHWHHWWFGFCLIMLSTASLDNWFDYFLQGIFWTFLTESILVYDVTVGEFFI